LYRAFGFQRHNRVMMKTKDVSGSVYEALVERRTVRLPLNGIDYAVHEWGEVGAPLLFCLHGWGDAGSSFQFLVDALAKVDSWHVVAPDWRGFGESGHNAGAYWFADYLADLHGLLEHYSPDTPVQILGHSMGGNVAGLYAGAFPERVAAFVNAEGFGLHDGRPESAPLRYRSWVERGSKDEAFSDYADFAALASKIRTRSPGMTAAQADFVARNWGAEAAGRVRLKADPKHRWPNAVLYRRAEAEACWRRVRATVLMVAGENSSFRAGGHPHDGEFDFDLPFPDIESVVLAGSGHMLHFEVPGALADVSRDFLRKNV